MLFACALVIGGCGGKSAAPTTPTPTTTTGAGQPAADDLCDSLAKVMDAAKDKFTSVAQVAPSGSKAAVAAGPINASWSATWPSTESYDVALSAMKTRVMACPFASRLTGGEAHKTEKDGQANAIDWTDAQTKTGVEIIAEGAGSISITVVAQ